MSHVHLHMKPIIHIIHQICSNRNGEAGPINFNMNLIYPILESNKSLESYEDPKGDIPNLLSLRIIT